MQYVWIVCVLIFVRYIWTRYNQAEEYRIRAKITEESSRLYNELLTKRKLSIESARKQYRSSLTIIFYDDVKGFAVRCSNGHRQALGDMSYAAGSTSMCQNNTRVERHTVETSTYMTDAYRQAGHYFPDAYVVGRQHSTQDASIPITEFESFTQTDYRDGCPVCHSSLFEFEDDWLREHVNLRALHKHQFEDTSPPYRKSEESIWLYLAKGVACPFCTIEQRFKDANDQRIKEQKRRGS